MTAGLGIVRPMASDRKAEQTFLGVCALSFAASAAVTIVWSASMSAMGGMPMPGGAASFVGMWVV